MFAAWYDMNWLPDIMKETWFMVVMGVGFLALLGVLLVLRNRRPEDD
jgi:hypothetical protein